MQAARDRRSASRLALLAGCGEPRRTRRTVAKRAPVLGRTAQAERGRRDLGFPGFATKNTTRVGGADPVADAAGVAQAVYPGQADDSRPRRGDDRRRRRLPLAVSAAQLMAPPLRAPILYSQDGKLPAGDARTRWTRINPRGAEKAGKAQVIRVGDRGRQARRAASRPTSPATKPAARRAARSTGSRRPPPASSRRR